MPHAIAGPPYGKPLRGFANILTGSNMPPVDLASGPTRDFGINPRCLVLIIGRSFGGCSAHAAGNIGWLSHGVLHLQSQPFASKWVETCDRYEYRDLQSNL